MQGWQFENDTRRLAGMARSRASVTLRTPRLAFTVVALLLLYAVGNLAILGALQSFVAIDAVVINAIAAPALIATALTGLTIGPSLYRGERGEPLPMIFGVGLV
jgi:hypothetical protein